MALNITEICIENDGLNIGSVSLIDKLLLIIF